MLRDITKSSFAYITDNNISQKFQKISVNIRRAESKGEESSET